MRRSIGCLAVLTVALVSICAGGNARAEVPFLLSYQGYLTDAVGSPVTGEWTMTFSFFHQPAGGDPFFAETLDVDAQLGLFNVLFGDVPGNALDHTEFSSGEVYLELSIETDNGPVILEPRQRVASNPFSFYADFAANAGQLGGEPAASYVTMQQVPDVCITPGGLEEAVLGLGFQPGGQYTDDDVGQYLADNGFLPCSCYSDDDVTAYLLQAGYVPGPHFSGDYEDLAGAPAVESLLTEENFLDFLWQSGAVVMADGSVALTGDLDFSGFEALNLAVHRSDVPPEEPGEGQLWWSTGDKVLRVYTGSVWALIDQGAAGDLACDGCVDEDDISFCYAAASDKGGAALSSLDVDCVDCVDAAEVSFAWAKGVLPGGDAEHALTADEASGLNCAACVQVGEIDPSAMAAGFVSFDDVETELGAGTVQAALEKIVAGGGGGGNFTEGNGTVLPYEQSWGLPAYGTASSYVHLMNPTQPKVVAYLYGEESTGFSTSNNLVVAYNFNPNQYSRIISANTGESAMMVDNPSIFTQGVHVMLHQSVGKNGNGADAGAWELTQVVGIEGTTILLAKPLAHSYVSCGVDCGHAQAVVAASYNQLEVVNGGHIYPSANLSASSKHEYGGIVFIRARKIVVKTGGKVTANSYGFRGGNSHNAHNGRRGASECYSYIDHTNAGLSPNCSGGGGGYCDPGKGGAGGGGNKAAGGAGTGSQPGQGGTAKGDGNLGTLHHGGGGGYGYCCDGGQGGGIIVLGAETIIVENGGLISADGAKGNGHTVSYCAGAGGGAGGTIALYCNKYINDGTVEANGGGGGTAPQGTGGTGGEGWVVQADPIPGTVNESYAKAVELHVDGVDITAVVGDPNQKGAPHWDEAKKKWGADGLHAWSSGPLDLTGVIDWTLGEHKVELKETGGSGGDLKMYTYVIYPFTESTPPANDKCTAPTMLDLSGPVKISGTTEDIMGKAKATDASQAPFCGGVGGPDVVFGFALDDWRQLTVDVKSAFVPRTYIKKGNCAAGEVMGCGNDNWVSSVLEPGTYYLFVDGDGNLQKGNFVLQVTPSPPGPPPNDNCGAPEQLNFENGTAKANGMTLFSGDDYQAACGGETAAENVYMFEVAAGTNNVSISLDADFNPVMYVAKDNCNSPPITCIPSDNGNLGWPTPGTYYLFVDGKTALDKGLYTITLTVN